MAGGSVNISGLYDFGGEVGAVQVMLKGGARSVRARWKGGVVHVTAPVGIGFDELRSILASMMPRLAQAKPEPLYRIGQRIEMPGLEVEIGSQTRKPDFVISSLRMPRGSIEVGAALDIEAPETVELISRMLCRMAASVAPRLLLPRAREVAEQVGARPSEWSISRGHRTLGHCDARGRIALSYALVFYPQELRDYVVCHELAHLSELNHSPRFHQICDRYCGGRERQLQAALRAYKIPIIR
ncbi:MAG: M48 family metallopeptidase [Muribaculaceae bacterium]|nr:M48 family metallopeptidase [Muribaculaceae bacterium]